MTDDKVGGGSDGQLPSTWERRGGTEEAAMVELASKMHADGCGNVCCWRRRVGSGQTGSAPGSDSRAEGDGQKKRSCQAEGRLGMKDEKRRVELLAGPAGDQRWARVR